MQEVCACGISQAHVFISSALSVTNFLMSQAVIRKKHPVLLGFLILGVIFLIFWGGVIFLISSATKPAGNLFAGRDGIGVVEIKGIIVSPEKVIRELREFQKSSTIKAVVLRVDCTGGAVGASQEIYKEVQRTNKLKPVVASMGSVAASGGYYVALGSEKILASPGTLTGSMGVIFKFINLEDLFQKIGYKSDVVKSGEMKDIGAANRPMTEEERKVLQELIDTVHSQFVRAIVTSRSLSEERVRDLADGRVFSGEQAREHGLIDEFGNFTDAVMLSAELAGIKDKYPHLVYPREKTIPFLKIFGGEAAHVLLNRFFDHFPVLFYEGAFFTH